MKPANLTSRLLARKGEAAPVASFPPAAANADKREAKNIWGKTDPSQPEKPAAPVKLPRVEQIAIKAKAKSKPKPEPRVAMTLRLDAAQHKRLRLISVHSQQSAREIMTAALDEYLDSLEEKLDISSCDCLNNSK